MEENKRNPATCATSIFSFEEGPSSIFKLSSCAAWRDIGYVNLRQLGLERRDTWERTNEGDDIEEVVVAIGKRSTQLCADCNLFVAKKDEETMPTVDVYPTDPEYSPDLHTYSDRVDRASVDAVSTTSNSVN